MKEVSSSDILMAHIEGLKEGKSYQFRVAAENEVGVGPGCELGQPIRPTAQLGKKTHDCSFFCNPSL